MEIPLLRSRFCGQYSELGGYRFQLELSHLHPRGDYNRYSQATSFFQASVIAHNIEEAVERAKEKWIIDNQERRKRGDRWSGTNSENGIIPKVKKSRMHLEDYREVSKRSYFLQ